MWCASTVCVALLFAGCGGDDDEPADPCRPDDDGNVHLGDVDAVLACDFGTDVRLVFINNYRGVEIRDYVAPDTAGMDEREARLAEQAARDAIVDMSDVEEWGDTAHDAFCVDELGGRVLKVETELVTGHVCAVDDANIPTLDAWRP